MVEQVQIQSNSFSIPWLSPVALIRDCVAGHGKHVCRKLFMQLRGTPFAMTTSALVGIFSSSRPTKVRHDSGWHPKRHLRACRRVAALDCSSIRDIAQGNHRHLLAADSLKRASSDGRKSSFHELTFFQEAQGADATAYQKGTKLFYTHAFHLVPAA